MAVPGVLLGVGTAVPGGDVVPAELDHGGSPGRGGGDGMDGGLSEGTLSRLLNITRLLMASRLVMRRLRWFP